MSRCVENRSLGPGRVPDNLTMRLPVCVGGMASFALSQLISAPRHADLTAALATSAAIFLLAGDPLTARRAA